MNMEDKILEHVKRTSIPEKEKEPTLTEIFVFVLIIIFVFPLAVISDIYCYLKR